VHLWDVRSWALEQILHQIKASHVSTAIGT